MACYHSTYGFNTNDFNGLSFKEVLLYTKERAEEIPEKVELTTLRNCRKKIKALRLKKEFELFEKKKKKKKNNNLSEKEKYIFFIKNYVSELSSQIEKWSEIFKSEEVDKTNRKHRELIEKIIPNANKIDEISFVFNSNLSKKYNDFYLKGCRNRSSFKQNNY